MDSPVFGGDMRSDATYTMLQSVDRCKPRLKTDEELPPIEPRVHQRWVSSTQATVVKTDDLANGNWPSTELAQGFLYVVGLAVVICAACLGLRQRESIKQRGRKDRLLKTIRQAQREGRAREEAERESKARKVAQRIRSRRERAETLQGHEDPHTRAEWPHTCGRWPDESMRDPSTGHPWGWYQRKAWRYFGPDGKGRLDWGMDGHIPGGGASR